MLNIPFEFHLRCGPAATALAADRALHNEVVFPATTFYEALARRLVLLFATHSQLESLTLTCMLQPEVDEDSTHHFVKLNQHLKLSTVGTTVFSTLDERAAFFADYVPTHRMGNGTFTLTRDNPVMRGILTAMQSESPVPDEVLERSDAAFFTLAQRVQRSFKSIQVDVHGGQILG